MNNIYSNSKTLLATAIVSFGLIFSGAALAGKDKPNKVKPGKPGELTIVQAALATEGFERLVEALLCFGAPSDNPFIELLSGEDDYTVFAPNNAAFDNFFGEGVDPCTAVPLPLLATVLQYHVTEGRRFANSAFNLNNPKMIEMLSGGYIMTMPNFTINDMSEMEPVGLGSLINFNASNGVIHEIDAILDPRPPVE
jgi:transforming growth factor-beta-induced protein